MRYNITREEIESIYKVEVVVELIEFGGVGGGSDRRVGCWD